MKLSNEILKGIIDSIPKDPLEAYDASCMSDEDYLAFFEIDDRELARGSAEDKLRRIKEVINEAFVEDYERIENISRIL